MSSWCYTLSYDADAGALPLGFPRHGYIYEMHDSRSLIAREYDVVPWCCIESIMKIKMRY